MQAILERERVVLQQEMAKGQQEFQRLVQQQQALQATIFRIEGALLIVDRLTLQGEEEG